MYVGTCYSQKGFLLTRVAAADNASPYSTGAAGASLTSTSLDPLTKGEMALYDEVCSPQRSNYTSYNSLLFVMLQEEMMYEDISRERKEKDRIKRRAYVRMVTNLGGSLNLELFCDKVQACILVEDHSMR